MHSVPPNTDATDNFYLLNAVALFALDPNN